MPAHLAFIESLMSTLDRDPGVVATGIVNNVPLSGKAGKSAAAVRGYVLRPGESERGHYSYSVGGNYFQAMGFELLDGRFLNEADSRSGRRVCVVDDDFAHYYWPHQSALGQQLFQGSELRPEAEAFTVVGVVGRVKQAGLADETAQGAVYYPYALGMDNNIFMVLRTSLPPQTLTLTLRKAVRQIDPSSPVNDLKTMNERVAENLLTRRSPTLLAAMFSAIALLLTAIGSYGVLSYAVAQRRREIGVRMALGAQPEQIRRQFFGMAARMVAGGLMAGAVGAWLMGRAMRALLFHVPAFSWPTMASAAGMLLTVSLAACLIPAWRAARISPTQAIAEE
jgi:predicted permease